MNPETTGSPFKDGGEMAEIQANLLFPFSVPRTKVSYSSARCSHGAGKGALTPQCTA